MKQKILDVTIKALIAILPVAIIASLGSFFTQQGMEAFELLQKPSQWVPSAVFGIVWTVIYTLFAFNNFHIQSKALQKRFWILFGINGLLNVLWCLTFFTLQQTLIGLFVIILNLIMSIFLLKELRKLSNVFFFPLTIYPLWLSLATALNLALWILN